MNMLSVGRSYLRGPGMPAGETPSFNKLNTLRASKIREDIGCWIKEECLSQPARDLPCRLFPDMRDLLADSGGTDVP
jgi:hypothetical protein